MLLTVKEAAERLGISTALMYALVAARRIRHQRHGLRRGIIRIPEDALDEYKASVTVGAEKVVPERRKLRHLT